MKLYATTTSERATKGQGGNDYIDIIINDDTKRVIAQIQLWYEKEKLLLKYNDCMGNEEYENITKGKR